MVCVVSQFRAESTSWDQRIGRLAAYQSLGDQREDRTRIPECTHFHFDHLFPSGRLTRSQLHNQMVEGGSPKSFTKTLQPQVALPVQTTRYPRYGLVPIPRTNLRLSSYREERHDRTPKILFLSPHPKWNATVGSQCLESRVQLYGSMERLLCSEPEPSWGLVLSHPSRKRQPDD